MVNRTELESWIALLRLRQWIKNGFVFAPLVFTGQFLSLHSVGLSVYAFVLFCLTASSVYIVNDINDLERDKLHPLKSKIRPLASGRVSRTSAIKLLLGLYCIVLISGSMIPALGGILLAYVVLNYGYTLKLKHMPVLDIFCIATGFVLRVYAGATVLAVPVSSWMFVTTLCIALYLAAVKRRQEMLQRDGLARAVLGEYSVALVTRYAEISATGALLFYSLFVMTARPELVATIPLVLYGMFRYWFLVEIYNKGESPTDVLLNDWQLIVTVILWLVICGYAVSAY